MSGPGDFSHIPTIDVRELVAGGPGRFAVAARLGEACRESGFFYALGHGVGEDLQQRLADESRRFFAQELDTKLRIRMALGGRAWRGYFPVGGELTSGRPDQKEGIYFGAELASDDPRVRAGTPLHGPNLFPEEPAGLRAAVLEYMDAMTRLGHRLVAGLALALDLPESYFAERYTAEGDTRMSAATEGKKRLARGFVVNDAMLADFKAFLQSEKIKIDEDAWTKDLEFIKAIIHYDIDLALFGISEAQKNLIAKDPQAQYALAQFGEAAKLTELAKNRAATKGGN